MGGYYNIEDIFNGYSILIRTPTPILGIKYCCNIEGYSFKYITRIKRRAKEGKQLNVVEYLTGYISKENIQKMLDNKQSVYITLESANDKKRTVNINGREKTKGVINNFETYKNNLPDLDILLSQMPIDIKKLNEIKENLHEK